MLRRDAKHPQVVPVDLEFPVGKEDGSNKGPYEQTCRCPLGRNPDPDRWPPDINKLSALTNGG